MKTTARVMLVSKSGKSIFVSVSMNKYDQGSLAGYCLNPDGLKVGDIIEDFPTVEGIENRKNDKGELLKTTTGEPLSFLVFKA